MEERFGWYNLEDGTLVYGCQCHTTTQLHFAGHLDSIDPSKFCTCVKPDIPQTNLDRFRAAQRDYKKQLDVPGSNPSENK
jgi:hypothetical protein